MDPRHQTPEYLAEQARNRRVTRVSAALVAGGLVACACLWTTVPIFWLGLTTDLTETQGTVFSVTTKVAPNVPSQPDATSCVATATYVVDDVTYVTDLVYGCPEEGDPIAVQYDASEPSVARAAPTGRFWAQVSVGTVALLVLLATLGMTTLAGARSRARVGSP